MTQLALEFVHLREMMMVMSVTASKGELTGRFL